jgi:hypothetical protein
MTSSSDQPDSRFKAYWADVRARAATLATAALGMLLLSTAFDEGLVKKLFEAVGIALLTTGVLDLMVGGRLRRDLSNEILDTVAAESGRVLKAVGLSAELEASGILAVHPRLLDWDEFMGGAAKIVLLPLPRPTHPDQDWAAALVVTHTRPVRIEIHVPSDTSPHMAALAERVGEDQAATLAAQLHALPGALVSQWHAAAPYPGSQLSIWTYNGVPGYAFVRADHRCALVVSTIAGPRPAERPRCFVLDVSKDETLRGWLEQQIVSLDSGELDLRTAP